MVDTGRSWQTTGQQNWPPDTIIQNYITTAFRAKIIKSTLFRDIDQKNVEKLKIML